PRIRVLQNIPGFPCLIAWGTRKNLPDSTAPRGPILPSCCKIVGRSFSERLIGGRMKLDLLAIAPHPDDVELTCGGTMIKMPKAASAPGIRDLTRGETGTRGTPEPRLKEAAKPAKAMGVAVRRNLGLPDAHLEVSESQKRAVAEVIREFEP